MAEDSGENPNLIISLKHGRGKEEPMVTRHLPDELLLDLLSRLPVKSLLRFRCVCKHWCALTMDSDFIKMHLNRSLATNTHISLIFKYPNFLSLDLDASEQVGRAVVEHLDLPFKRRAKVVGSCNGLLCISSSDEELYLWNPSTRRHQNLPATFATYPNRSASSYRRFIYGFGYEPVTDDYKIIRIVQFYRDQSLVEVYSLSTNSWRKIKNLPQHINSIYGIGFVANSAIHWKETTSKFIVSFDLKDEEFVNLSLPHFLQDGSAWNIGVLAGKLCIVHRLYGVREEVWTMKEYGVRDSWVKLFSIKNLWVTMSAGGIMPLCYSRNGQLVLQNNSEALVLYDPSEKILKFLGIQGAPDPDSNSTHVCVGSLVPLNDKDYEAISKNC